MSSNGKVRIHWITQENNIVGNALGYNVHNSMMRKYCLQLMTFDESAKVALTITPADFFVPVPDKVNILFTMWECLDIPQSYIEAFKKADLIIVPSSFCRDIFRKVTNKPIEVCWLGIEPENLPFYQRRFPHFGSGERFRFLYLGAPNPRKGYYSILEIVKIAEKIPEWEIYIKTTAHKKSTLTQFLKINFRRMRSIMRDFRNKKDIKNEFENMCMSFKRFFMPEVADKVTIFGKYKNIIFDTRKLPFEELINLYNSAHCFLAPHTGEGWCLPLCEAMATGCPSIATGASGCMDFFNDAVGYPIKYEIKENELLNYNLKARVFIPDTRHLLQRMFEVINNYKEALRRGKKASERIHNKFTWDKSALRLKEIIENYASN